MLAVVMTDASLTAECADMVLRRAGDASFNSISVEGHTSTSDTVLLLAGGSGKAADIERLHVLLDLHAVELDGAVKSEHVAAHPDLPEAPLADEEDEFVIRNRRRLGRGIHNYISATITSPTSREKSSG